MLKLMGYFVNSLSFKVHYCKFQGRQANKIQNFQTFVGQANAGISDRVVRPAIANPDCHLPLSTLLCAALTQDDLGQTRHTAPSFEVAPPLNWS